MNRPLLPDDDIRKTKRAKIDGAEGPPASPDFQSRHRCKNFDDIREWAVENMLLVGDGYEPVQKEASPENRLGRLIGKGRLVTLPSRI